MEQTILREFADRNDTPAYIFDLDILRERVQMIKKCLGEDICLCYAMKANPFLIGPLHSVIDKYEVCSPGEFHICERAGIPRERIVLSGVNKEEEDIAYVMRRYGNAGIYTIESRKHLQILEKCAAEESVTVKALIRVTSGNQFGVDEGEVLAIVAQRRDYPHVVIEGIQCYSGTQKKKFSKIEKELDQLDELCQKVKDDCGYEVRELEYGPGFYVPYFVNDKEVDDEGLLGQFAEKLRGLKFRGKITLEMGRYIAAYCGYYMTRIMDTKVNKGQGYCIVDGGIHHLNYFGQAMAMKIPHFRHIKVSEEERKTGAVVSGMEAQGDLWNVCGSLCTVNDVLVKQMPLVDAKIGDVLVFERVGAYSVTEGIYLFLSRDLPRIFFWSSSGGLVQMRGALESYLINSSEIIR